ncbi:unnamed protein product [Vitrella brassicaformis CCMP3155]|uniref:Cyclin-dependent kinase 2 homolog n=2 Tax=Vitrella brassicaformis TaxID=1169539 RepID=A0A0G4EU98_VITBC|nr:unnamed protein product [Vitrella brassicaformis CCMP3155]|mmetsp:Transcript_40085/g.100316  ORF Transcript_40085/g.100316 Transcript_40085/m.100316 type:complete len:340 (+) Transcript_40085:104-1123(+)|eukprot:CEM01665.1 unnamed protein product [Vitrella brassicaformis CCMP3155]
MQTASGATGEAQAPSTTTSKGSGRYSLLDANIGAGTYGTVAKALDKATNKIVAVKRVKLDRKCVDEEQHSGRLPVGEAGIHFTVLREIKIMKEIRHKNVMGLIDVYAEGDFVNLVMDFMHTDLKKFLGSHPQLTEAHIKGMMQQILQGLEVMHSWYFIHRDLAPANVFINAEGEIKLGDFGLARSHGSPDRAMTPQVVTIWYRPPELLYFARLYSDKVDIWSVGCIFAEMLLGRPLFNGQGEVDQLAKIFDVMGTPTETNWPGAKHLPRYCEFTYAPPQDFRQVFGPGVSELSLALLRQLLVLNPNQRISAKEALAHEYFKTPPYPCAPSQLPLGFLRK